MKLSITNTQKICSQYGQQIRLGLHVILVSALGPDTSLGQGLGLGPGTRASQQSCSSDVKVEA